MKTTEEVTRDFSGFDESERKKAVERDENAYNRIRQGDGCLIPGQACTPLIEPLPSYDVADCEEVYPSNKAKWGQTRIVFGRDRSERDHFSGYGGKGATTAGMIDMVAGSGGRAPKHGQKVGPNFQNDAARVYLSQRADIDNYMSLPYGEGTGLLPSVNRSAAALKADAVRLYGREGIRLYTSAPGEINSRGGDIQSTGPERGIHLIANKDVASFKTGHPTRNNRLTVQSLQPMVKGDNLKIALEVLLDQIKDVAEAVESFMNQQMTFNNAISTHTHTVAGIGAGVAAPDPVLIVNNLKTTISNVQNTVSTFAKKKADLGLGYEKTFLDSATAEFSILSNYNKTN